ncbi:uncharacterized protein LOC125233615 [Leguminivora glycinivorella]|uniref:uncharacterized protein LOC125233615 n=1 Tax=Leguminivora glycinivorella TaxID=1035111 RepID=UPI00200D776D|nr:uncharacterized protein LOC125233615 [Leguminivora glycinivorella]
MNSFSNIIYFFSIFCVSLVLASSLREAKRISKCSKTICPLVKATICVKVKEQNNPRRYVLMSKCELKVVKCYGDVKTTVVPAKFCNAALRQGDDLPIGGGGVINVSDDADASVPLEVIGLDKDEAVDDSSPPKQGEGLEQEDPVNDSSPLKKEDQEDPVNDSSPPKEEGGLDQEEPVKDSDDPAPVKDEDANVSDNHEVLQVEGDKDNDEEKQGADDLHLEKVDQPEVACPENCPARGVMVCARCPHGIHRTFMSSCFMRMYQCQHPNEKLELVSRHACTGSAPYMGEMPKPVGEPDVVDKDPILNHIFYRKSISD